jgi:hypothetical protein
MPPPDIEYARVRERRLPGECLTPVIRIEHMAGQYRMIVEDLLPSRRQTETIQ